MSGGRISLWTPTEVALVPELEALKPPPVHTGWTNAVSQRCVHAIAISSDSRTLWLATWGGVIAWDRREKRAYRRYSGEHGLAGNAVSCLCLDGSGRPWAGHPEGGLSYFDGERWKVNERGPTEPVRALCRGSRGGDVWVATHDAVYHVRGPDRRPDRVATDHDGAVEARALLADGTRLLLGNAWGLFRVEAGRTPLQVLPEEIASCTALTRDTQGRIWLATESAVLRLKGDAVAGRCSPAQGEEIGRVLNLAAGKGRVWVLGTWSLATVSDERWTAVRWTDVGEAPRPLLSIAPSSEDSYIWAGSDEGLGGVWMTEPDGGGVGSAVGAFDRLPAHSEDRLNNLGRCVVAGPEGTVWIGTAGGLASRGESGGWTVLAGAGDVRALCVTGAGVRHTLWMLSRPGGVGALIPPDQVRFPRLGLRGVPVALAASRLGDLHVLTGQGLWRLQNGATEEVGPAPPGAVTCLTESPAGAPGGPEGSTWWLGTGGGIYRRVFRRGTWGWQYVGEPDGPGRTGIRAMVWAHDALWVGTEAGLWSYSEDRWVRHPVDPADPEAGVRALAPASAGGAVWIAREDGVALYHPVNGLTALFTPSRSGLGSRRVVALLENAGMLWIVTRAGISRATLAEVNDCPA